VHALGHDRERHVVFDRGPAVEHEAGARSRLDRQREANHVGDELRTRPRGIHNPSGTELAPGLERDPGDPARVRLDADDAILDEVRAVVDRTLAVPLKERPPVEGAFDHRTHPRARQGRRVHVRELGFDLRWRQHARHGSMLVLHRHLLLEPVQVVIRSGEKEIAGAAVVECGRLSVDLGVLVEVVDELQSELTDLDVDRLAELLSDRILCPRR